jgi:hypothetical protein
MNKYQFQSVFVAPFQASFRFFQDVSMADTRAWIRQLPFDHFLLKDNKRMRIAKCYQYLYKIKIYARKIDE